MKKQVLALVAAVSVSTAQIAYANYAERPEVKAMADRLATQGVSRDFVLSAMGEAKRLDSVINAMNRPAERKAWRDYRPIFLKPERARAAAEFYSVHRDTLHRAEAELGVPVEIILAIIGVETYYGRNKGSFRVIDALATLGLDYPRRAEFFLGELESLFLLGKAESLDPLALKGSYAGAMGYGQFIPSSYLAYSIDFDGDGRRDLLENPVDAIGSVANYLARHGWDANLGIAHPISSASQFAPELERSIKIQHRGDQLIAAGVTGLPTDWVALDLDVLGLDGAQGTEYWAVTKNFYAITRYNRSPLYAMAVTQLASEIEKEITP